MFKVVEVCATHPTGKALIVEVRTSFDGVDADSLLTSIAPLFADNVGAQGCWSHDQDHEFDVIEGFGDLEPPVTSSFQADAVLPEGNACGFQTLAQVLGDGFTICTSVRDDDTSRIGETL